MAYRNDTDQDRVVFQAEQGCLESLPACWTSVISSDPHLAVGEGQCRFRVKDLLKLVQVLKQPRPQPKHSVKTRKRRGVK